MTRRPDLEELDAAAGLLGRVGAAYGLSNLRTGQGRGQIVADVADDRTYFDVVAFEAEIEARFGWRPEVVSSAASGARPARTLVRPAQSA